MFLDFFPSGKKKKEVKMILWNVLISPNQHFFQPVSVLREVRSLVSSAEFYNTATVLLLSKKGFGAPWLEIAWLHCTDSMVQW